MAEPPPAWPPEPPAPAGLNPLPPLPPAPGLRLRPLSFGELLDEIFRVYRRHFWLFVSIALLLALLAMGTSAGAFGGPAAAAEGPPNIGTPNDVVAPGPSGDQPSPLPSGDQSSPASSVELPSSGASASP